MSWVIFFQPPFLCPAPDLFAKETVLFQDSCLLCGDLGHVRGEVLRGHVTPFRQSVVDHAVLPLVRSSPGAR